MGLIGRTLTIIIVVAVMAAITGGLFIHRSKNDLITKMFAELNNDNEIASSKHSEFLHLMNKTKIMLNKTKIMQISWLTTVFAISLLTIVIGVRLSLRPLYVILSALTADENYHRLGKTEEFDFTYKCIEDLKTIVCGMKKRPEKKRPEKALVCILLDAEIAEYLRIHAGDRKFQTSVNEILKSGIHDRHMAE